MTITFIHSMSVRTLSCFGCVWIRNTTWMGLGHQCRSSCTHIHALIHSYVQFRVTHSPTVKFFFGCVGGNPCGNSAQTETHVHDQTDDLSRLCATHTNCNVKCEFVFKNTEKFHYVLYIISEFALPLCYTLHRLRVVPHKITPNKFQTCHMLLFWWQWRVTSFFLWCRRDRMSRTHALLFWTQKQESADEAEAPDLALNCNLMSVNYSEHADLIQMTPFTFSLFREFTATKALRNYGRLDLWGMGENPLISMNQAGPVFCILLYTCGCVLLLSSWLEHTQNLNACNA